MNPSPRRRKGFNLFRRPNAELAALSLEIDLGAISLIEGLRAALATAIIIAINQWLRWPLLNIVALGAMLSCLCDIGGPLARRLTTILCFAAGGGAMFALFGMARADAVWLVLPVACILLFSNAFLRIWGPYQTQLGNMLSVVMIFSIDRPAHLSHALLTGGAFTLGGVWVAILTLALGRVRPHQPAYRAVGGVYRCLAALAGDMKLLADDPQAPQTAWDDHARAHRRAVRDAIENAREIVHQTLRSFGPVRGVTVQSPIRLEAADEIFGVLIGLSALIQADPTLRPAASRVLRLLEPLLRVMGEAIEHREDPDPAAVERAIASVNHIADSTPGMAGVMHELAERLRLAVSVAGPVVADMDPADANVTQPPAWGRIRERFGDHLTWDSAIFRHSLRTMVLGGLALAASMASGEYYSHWFTLVLVLTLQPFFANTRQRAIERGIGTGLGVLVVSLLAMLVHSPLAMAAALLPVTLVAFTLRRVSFALFISCLTPFVVLLVELGHSDVGAGGIALQRLVYTVTGGVIAVVGNRFLWPLWEPLRMRELLAKALKAHADFVMADKTDDMARRGAGRASNALETSLARALAEPRKRGDRTLEAALVADAALRRIGGHIAALALQSRDIPPDLVWRGWIAESLRAMAEERSIGARPETPLMGGLVPIAQQIELMAGAIRK